MGRQALKAVNHSIVSYSCITPVVDRLVAQNVVREPSCLTFDYPCKAFPFLMVGGPRPYNYEENLRGIRRHKYYIMRRVLHVYLRV